MRDQSISPSSTSPDPNNPNLTIPRSFGVWELPEGSAGDRYRYGDNPVMGTELSREFGPAILIALYTTERAAKSHADEIN